MFYLNIVVHNYHQTAARIVRSILLSFLMYGGDSNGGQAAPSDSSSSINPTTQPNCKDIENYASKIK